MEKQKWEQSEKGRRRRSGKRKSEKKEDADARKGRKVAIHCVFSMICGWEPSGSPGHFLEASGSFRGPLGASDLFGKKKLDASEASESFWEPLAASGSFWKLSGSFREPSGRKVGSLKRRVRNHLARWVMKIAHRCGAKHISKSKCTPASDHF